MRHFILVFCAYTFMYTSKPHPQPLSELAERGDKAYRLIRTSLDPETL